MWLMDKALRRLVKRGELSIVDHDGTAYRYGSFAAELEPVTIRFTDARISGAIVRNPELAAAEGYMDGRLVFEQGDILALVLLVTANNRWEDGVPRGRSLLDFEKARGWFKARNREARAKRNVAHHYDIGNALYRRRDFTDRPGPRCQLCASGLRPRRAGDGPSACVRSDRALGDFSL